jgi:hypothetical protein
MRRTAHTGRAAARVPAVGAALLCAALAPAALAQEAMYTEAATMPSPGTFVLREQYHFAQYGKNPVTGSDSIHVHEWMSSLQYGIVRNISFRVDVPVQWRSEHDGGDDDNDKGVEELDLMLKWRFFQSDTGGVDTLRAALMGGVEVPSGDDDDYSGNTVSPMIGAVVTLVRGRHGFNQDVFFKWNTSGGTEKYNFGGEGDDNAFTHNTSYLFRLLPERYGADTIGAWYATAEITGIYETNGDYELRWAPGIMYEGRLFALEIMAQLPLYEDVHDRPELDWRAGIGVRFAF